MTVGWDQTEARFLAPGCPRTLALPKARLRLQGDPRCGGPTAKQKETWLPGGLGGSQGGPGGLFYLRFQKKQTPGFASHTVPRVDLGN